MQEVKRRWKVLRAEVVILIIVPTIALLLVALAGLFNNPALGSDFWINRMYMRFFGWQIFHAIGFIGLGYVVLSAVVCAMQRRRLGIKGAGKSSPAAEWFAERFQVAKSFICLAAVYAYALTVNVVVMSALCFPNPQRVAWANDFLMRADRMLFGTFVPFEMHEHSLYAWLAPAMLFCYLKLTVAFSVVLAALFIFRAGRFRQYVLAFVTIMFFCMPGWALLPATTPSEAYRTSKLHLQTAFEIDYEIADPVMHLNPDVNRFLNEVDPYQSDPAVGRYFITSIPSLHVAWGVIIVWFGVELYSRSILLLLPWGLLNCVGAIFTLQHYAVDAVAGIIVAVIAVYLVRGLVALEARKGLDAPKGYGLCKSIQEDIQTLGRAVFPPLKKRVGRAKI
jgi:hypothetical protein